MLYMGHIKMNASKIAATRIIYIDLRRDMPTFITRLYTPQAGAPATAAVLPPRRRHHAD